MTLQPAYPRFPLHEPLARFFAANPRGRVAISQLADLLGITNETLRAILTEDGRRRVGRTVAWSEAAGYIFESWPRTDILATLGDNCSRRIPQQFHPTLVSWSIPIFIVRAMEHQAAKEWRRDPRLQSNIFPNHSSARGIADYVTDLLFNEIHSETLVAFRDDEAFQTAYRYPDHD